MANPVLHWLPIIRQASAQYGIPASVLAAQIQIESGGREGLTSSAGAKGLTQFMPGTAQTYGVNVNPGHAHSQIFGAAHYLSNLGFSKDARKAIASYAAGPGNYQAGLSYADQLLKTAKQYSSLDNGTQVTPSQPPSQPAQPQAAPAAQAPDASGQRAALISQYLGNEHAPDALTTLAMGLVSMGVSKQIAVKTVPATGAAGNSPVTAPGSVPDQVRTLIERANQIDAKHFNYEWGGGHNPSGSPTHGVGHGSGAGIGFDCSGAVSKVFGINPLVASQFMSWGKPGRGKNVTVYAKGTHVLMEINGHFFGTSGSNPGGGAGWIPSAALPASYLAGFVARHPAGL